MDTTTKLCKGCAETKTLTDFYKDKSKRYGVSSQCKVCVLKRVSKYKEDNPDLVKESKKKHFQKFKGKYMAASKKWAKNNEAKRKVIASNWKKRNRDYECYQQNLRRANQLKATPGWLTQEQLQHIKDMYVFRKNISGVVGREYHVDHIVPLQSEVVCGLHVPWNLQVIPAKDNLSKSNSTDHLDTLV